MTWDVTRASSGALPTATLPFFLVTLGFTWLLQLPALLAKFEVIPGPMERYLLPAALGGFGPLLAALFVARFEPGGSGARSVFRTLRIVHVGAKWYAVALGVFAAIYVAGVAGYRLGGGSESLRWLYLPVTPQHLVALLLVPLTEEPGWRGFALPRLQQRYGALEASLRLGAVWAVWHSLMFVLQGATPATFLLGMLIVLAGSVVFSWIYNHTRGSLFLALLTHLGVHLNNPFHALPAQAPLAIYSAALVVFALGLVFADRTLGRAPQSSP